MCEGTVHGQLGLKQQWIMREDFEGILHSWLALKQLWIIPIFWEDKNVNVSCIVKWV